MSWEKKLAYWENYWEEILDDDNQHNRNARKFRYLFRELWKRPHYAGMKKLDIGCGPGMHANAMTLVYPQWVDNWVGVDISPRAIETVQKELGYDGRLSSIEDFETDERFELFLLLDTLEHIEERDKLADSIKRLAADEFFVFGNIPMYPNEEPDYIEKSVNPFRVGKILRRAGCKHIWTHIYGVHLAPYMLFEGRTSLDGPPLEKLSGRRTWYNL